MNSKQTYTSKNGSENGSILGNREHRLFSQAVQIEETLMPRFVRSMLLLIAVLVVVFLVWASFAQLTEVARAPGEIIPIGQTKVVQHLDGGEVAEILVDEGDLVEPGQILLRIDGSQAIADLKQMEARWLALTLRSERLLAFAEGRTPSFEPSRLPEGYIVDPDDPEMGYEVLVSPHMGLVNDQYDIYLKQVSVRNSSLAVVSSQIDQLGQRMNQTRKSLTSARQHMELVGELLEMREAMGDRQLVTRTELLETRRAMVTSRSEVDRLLEEIDVLQESLKEAQLRRQDIDNQFRRDALTERGDALAELAEVEEALKKLRARVYRLNIRASVRGLIHDFRIWTVGQVIQPGEVLMNIVPTDAILEAEVRIEPRDMGHVATGQPVKVRVSSYDYRRFGNTEGVLRRITATNVVDDDGEPYFRGWVELDRHYVGDDSQRFRILPGMSVEAEIITGRKTLLAYLFTPVADIIDRSFGER